ncbi:bifunctional nuclease family protein [Natronobeatus ordinarius]|uniref:bifunctional nuclease family protein n=1 Tax=Natronobeatus ordinarius TaxID=2963433 RepID=UPI0020CF1C53|nr:bifunctional nuclease family protein [Natronobeatus ordinarius]
MSNPAEVKAVGVSVDEEGVGAPAVVLEAREELLPIFVGPGQARSIEEARQNVPSERPMTHDLLVEMITDFGGAFDRVRIDDLAGGTFYAKVDAELIRDGERQQKVFDARPSDAIALAVRVDCPITVTDDVLDRAGVPADALDVEDVDDVDRDMSGW